MMMNHCKKSLFWSHWKRVSRNASTRIQRHFSTRGSTVETPRATTTTTRRPSFPMPTLLQYRPLSTAGRSVSPAEVSKFSGMNEEWWDRSNLLLQMNPIRVEYIVQHAAAATGHPPLKGLKALDVGCGGGILSESLARLGADVTAIDPSAQLVHVAQQRAQMDPLLQSIDYRGGSSIESLESTQKYDIICILEVVEHVVDMNSIFEAAASLLASPHGTLFVSSVNRNLKSYGLTIVGAEYIMGYLPVGTHEWNRYKMPEEVAQSVQKVGLVQADVCGMALTCPPLFGKWNWKLDPNDLDVNWIGAYRHSS